MEMSGLAGLRKGELQTQLFTGTDAGSAAPRRKMSGWSWHVAEQMGPLWMFEVSIDSQGVITFPFKNHLSCQG